jgi:hypothetical protein
MGLERVAIALKLLGTARTHADWTHASCWWVCMGKALALMSLGQHAHCTARMACGMCEQHMFRWSIGDQTVDQSLYFFLIVVAVNEVTNGCQG